MYCGRVSETSDTLGRGRWDLGGAQLGVYLAALPHPCHPLSSGPSLGLGSQPPLAWAATPSPGFGSSIPPTMGNALVIH